LGFPRLRKVPSSDGYQAAIAQLGERQTEDLKVFRSRVSAFVIAQYFVFWALHATTHWVRQNNFPGQDLNSLLVSKKSDTSRDPPPVSYVLGPRPELQCFNLSVEWDFESARPPCGQLSMASQATTSQGHVASSPPAPTSESGRGARGGRGGCYTPNRVPSSPNLTRNNLAHNGGNMWQVRIKLTTLGL
jgi:hypothetical protein